MATQTQMYIPIRGVEYLIIPEVAQRGKNLFETQLYAQENGLIVLSSRDINKVARSVQAEKPSRNFTRYARDRTDLNDKDVADAYRKLRNDIWNEYRIRAREVLMWVPTKSIMHPRLISDQSPDTEVVSILLRDYKVVDSDKLDIIGISPDSRVRVNWITSNGTITEEMVRLLGIQDWDYAQETGVWNNQYPTFYEGLRALFWDFRDYVLSVLVSEWEPWDKDFDLGSLLGRKLEPKQ